MPILLFFFGGGVPSYECSREKTPNPHSNYQGSNTRVPVKAWRLGFRA